MTIQVYAVTFEIATITVTPSWWRRLLLRDQVTTRFAIYTTHGWYYDYGGAPVVDSRLLRALDAARLDAVRMFDELVN